MPELPAEAVQAATLAHERWYIDHGGDPDAVYWTSHEQWASATLEAAVPFLAGVRSPVSCPSVAPESTQSPETPSVAPVYPPAPTEPAETLSALRGRYADALAATCKLHEIEGECPACERRLIAVLAVRDEELSRTLRIADYHAGQHRQAAERADRMAEMVIEKDREATQWADWLHQAEATIARIDALHQPKVITEIRYCDHHMAEARTRAVKPAEWQACADCTSRPVVACSEIRCCVWPCEPHLILHGETADTCAHRAGAASEEQTGHACGNCEGIDPASCINAPRPPASTTEETNPHA
jgi:hypothetical protein